LSLDYVFRAPTSLPLPRIRRLTAAHDHNLGFANLIHFHSTRRRMPDVTTMPDLSMPRSRMDKDSSHAFGITPFTPMKSSDSDTDDKPGKMTTVSDGEVTVSWSVDVNKMSSEKLDPDSSVSASSEAHLLSAYGSDNRVFPSHPTLRDERVPRSQRCEF
jgi:hypothetical protein